MASISTRKYGNELLTTMSTSLTSELGTFYTNSISQFTGQLNLLIQRINTLKNNLKNNLNDQSAAKDLEALYKKAYEVISQMREFFTGDQINYEIHFNDPTQGNYKIAQFNTKGVLDSSNLGLKLNGKGELEGQLNLYASSLKSLIGHPKQADASMTIMRNTIVERWKKLEDEGGMKYGQTEKEYISSSGDKKIIKGLMFSSRYGVGNLRSKIYLNRRILSIKKDKPLNIMDLYSQGYNNIQYEKDYATGIIYATGEDRRTYNKGQIIESLSRNYSRLQGTSMGFSVGNFIDQDLMQDNVDWYKGGDKITSATSSWQIKKIENSGSLKLSSLASIDTALNSLQSIFNSLSQNLNDPTTKAQAIEKAKELFLDQSGKSNVTEILSQHIEKTIDSMVQDSLTNNLMTSSTGAAISWSEGF